MGNHYNDGTGAVTCAGAVTPFRTFASQYADTDTLYYTLYDGTNFEVGLGTYASGTTTAGRTMVQSVLLRIMAK